MKKTAVLAERLAITELKPSQEAIGKMSELNVEPKQRKIRNPKEPLPFSPRVTRSQKK